MNQKTEKRPESALTDTPAPSERHGCLTFWLWWLVFVNGLVACIGPFVIPEIRAGATPGFPERVAWAIGAVSALRLLCLVVLFHWYKWGFHGYALGAVAVYVLNVYGGASPAGTSLEFCGTVVLFLLLHIGGRLKAWTRLK